MKVGVREIEEGGDERVGGLLMVGILVTDIECKSKA